MYALFFSTNFIRNDIALWPCMHFVTNTIRNDITPWHRSQYDVALDNYPAWESLPLPSSTVSPKFGLNLSLNRGVVGAPQMTSQPVSSIFLRSPLHALWDLADSRPVHSLMLSSHLVFGLPCLLPPFHCALQDDFGQT